MKKFLSGLAVLALFTVCALGEGIVVKILEII